MKIEITTKHLRIAGGILAPIIGAMCAGTVVEIDVDIHGPNERITPAPVQRALGFEPNTYGVNNPLPDELLGEGP